MVLSKIKKALPESKSTSIRSRWDEFTYDQWKSLARGWLVELEAGESARTDFGMTVTLMNFTAQASQQWIFVETCVSLAETEDQLGHIAAGPCEHLLGHHGSEFIDAVEAKAATDEKFLRMVSSAWQYLMPDDIWQRIQLIQSKAPTI